MKGPVPFIPALFVAGVSFVLGIWVGADASPKATHRLGGSAQVSGNGSVAIGGNGGNALVYGEGSVAGKTPDGNLFSWPINLPKKGCHVQTFSAGPDLGFVVTVCDARGAGSP